MKDDAPIPAIVEVELEGSGTVGLSMIATLGFWVSFRCRDFASRLKLKGCGATC